MLVRLRIIQGLLFCALLTLFNAACEDDPHDLDYLKDSGSDHEHDDGDGDERDAATPPVGDDDAG